MSKNRRTKASDRIGIRLPRDLKEWAVDFCDEQGMGLSTLLRNFLTQLKDAHEKNNQADEPPPGYRP